MCKNKKTNHVNVLIPAFVMEIARLVRSIIAMTVAKQTAEKMVQTLQRKRTAVKISI